MTNLKRFFKFNLLHYLFIQIYVYNLQKWSNYYKVIEIIRKWCLVLLSENKKELERNLSENIMSDKAKRQLSGNIEKLSNDEDEIVLYTKLSKEELERNTLIEEARIAKEKARIDGLEEGRAEGMKKGIKQDKIEVARNMKNKNIDINIISECTGLAIEELNTI